MNTTAPTFSPIYVIGLGLPGAKAPLPSLLIDDADALIGGAAVLKPFAAHPAEKIVVSARMEAVYSRVAELRAKGKRLVALCSGDPLFFGLGARLAERFGPEAVRVLPAVSSLQAAAALTGLAWENMACVSLHGRSSTAPLAHALLQNRPVCVLCDANVSPRTIAEWLCERGLGGCRLHVLDSIHYDQDGTIQADAHSVCQAADCPATTTPHANRVIVLEPPASAPPLPFGLDDNALDHQAALITKRPVRAAGLALLAIEPAHVVWDIGAGSGAVSIEAARLAYTGQVYALESRQDRLAAIRANRMRFRACNMEIVRGAFPSCLLDDSQALPRPNRIFVGGGLSGTPEHADAFLRAAWRELLPGGKLVAHCVLLSSLEYARATLETLAAKVHV